MYNIQSMKAEIKAITQESRNLKEAHDRGALHMTRIRATALYHLRAKAHGRTHLKDMDGYLKRIGIYGQIVFERELKQLEAKHTLAEPQQVAV